MPRPYKALRRQGYKHYFTALTGRTRIAIIHSKTSLSVIAGEACLAPTKPCGVKAINTILLPLQGAHELRLFIPIHHCRLLRVRRAAPYGGGSITACQGTPLQPQCNLKIRSAHLTGEACLTPTKPCGGKAIDVILLPLQGAHELRLFIPKYHLSVIAGEACLAIRRGFYYGVPWRAATTAMLSENTPTAYLTGEACFARITIWIQCVPHWRARRASPLQSLAEARL